MDETILEHYDAKKQERQERGHSQRAAAQTEYEKAAAFASEHGIAFKQFNAVHYQLVWPNGAIVNVFPGNRRLCRDKTRPAKAPHLNVGPTDEPWLTKVVEAAVATVAGRTVS